MLRCIMEALISNSMSDIVNRFQGSLDKAEAFGDNHRIFWIVSSVKTLESLFGKPETYFIAYYISALQRRRNILCLHSYK
jgi:hypothetical protein